MPIDNPGKSADFCQLCEWESVGLPGGWFLQNEHWSAGVYPTFFTYNPEICHEMSREVPGQVVIQLRRHVGWITDMTSEELESLGPVLALVTRAVDAQTHPERVYYSCFAEAVPHVHFMLTPRGAEIAQQHRGAALLTHAVAELYSDPAMADDVSERIRAGLSSPPLESIADRTGR
jgi:diadenosine tetraphosphate (Ap4A) HIT family hydrolase